MPSPFGQRMKVTRHGSLLCVCPIVKPFSPETFADVCEHVHSYNSGVGKDDIVTILRAVRFFPTWYTPQG